MKGFVSAASAALTLAGGASSSPVTDHSGIIFFKPTTVTTDSVHNIHVGYNDDAFEGEVRVVYGSCDMREAHHMHHEIGSTTLRRSLRPGT